MTPWRPTGWLRRRTEGLGRRSTDCLVLLEGTDTAGAPARVIDRIRTTCLALPEAVEKSFGGHTSPGFRVRDKLFVIMSEDRSWMTLKAPPGFSGSGQCRSGDRFFVPHYVGSKGWVGVRIALKRRPTGTRWPR